MKKRKIAVITSSRADYGHLYWTLKAIQQNSSLALQLIVGGAHLAEEFGYSVNQIEKDGFVVSARLDTLVKEDSKTAMAETMAKLAVELTAFWQHQRPDVLLVIADRYEMLAPATVALCLGLPIVHIEGGDISQGAIDDQVRNGLTKMSHFHFAPTAEAVFRLQAMGEAKTRIQQVGALSLDNLSHQQIPDKCSLEQRLGFKLEQPPIIVCLHPVTISDNPAEDAKQTLLALKSIQRKVIFCFPNADCGYRQIVKLCTEYGDNHSNAYLLVNLEHRFFWRLMMESDCMLGNSSAGIMETASISLPTVDVGDRQKGRTRAKNIIHAEAKSAQILSQLKIALSAKFKQQLKNIENPYSVDNHAAEKIATTLASLTLDSNFLRKEFYSVSRQQPYYFNQN